METFSGAQVRMHIRGRAIHPGWAKGELVNAIKLAAAVVEKLPQDTLSPETTEEREGFVHPMVISGDSSEVELRFIVRDFENDLLDQHVELLPDDRRRGRVDRRPLLDRGRDAHPVPQHARHARAAPRDRREPRGGRPAGRASSRSRPRSAAAPTARLSPRWACRRRTSSPAATTPTASASGSASRTWASQQRRSSHWPASGPNRGLAFRSGDTLLIWSPCSTSSAARSRPCASRSPTGAISAACTACRRRSTAATTSSSSARSS